MKGGYRCAAPAYGVKMNILLGLRVYILPETLICPAYSLIYMYEEVSKTEKMEIALDIYQTKIEDLFFFRR